MLWGGCSVLAAFFAVVRGFRGYEMSVFGAFVEGFQTPRGSRVGIV